MDASCDRRWEIDLYRAKRLGEKDARSFERHLRVCSACREQLAEDARLQQLACRLHEEAPSELALRRVRGRLLRDVATGVVARAPSRWERRLALAGLLVAAGLAGWTWNSRRETPQRPVLAVSAPLRANLPEPYAGSVVASDAALWSQERSQGVERVTLSEGLLHIHVRPQGPAERFLVALPDGAAEVRGTTFDVLVERGATTRLHVEEGTVELHLQGHDAKRLTTGETWPAPTSAPTPARSFTPAPAPASPDAYTAAMRLLREGHDEEAAAAFHAFAQSQPRASQAEDASFLEAVALARAGRGDAAALAAEHHLASFPGSFHRKDASILVARAAAQRGECARARATLAPWGDDADVKTALRACP